MTVFDLPAINAGLNTCSFILLLAGFIFIKKGEKEAHKYLMHSALITSVAFLVCYLIYHYYAGSKKFPDLGMIKTFYLIMLATHVILAIVMVPMIITTFIKAYKKDWERHKFWAKITFPIWLYVSLTGILIYLMLYRWYA